MSNSKIRVDYSESYKMPRPVNLRQIEVFKSVIELGTVSRAAEVLHVSQPAASKLLMQLESDNRLRLFDRQKGRLVPTPQALHLYEEIERIFSGVQQVESAIALIKREGQGRLFVGLPPGLAGTFIHRTIARFLTGNPDVYCVIQSRRSRWLVEDALNRQVDVSISPTPIDNPNFVVERIAAVPLVCIMPVDHPMAERDSIRPEHLDGIPFVSFDLDSITGKKVADVFEQHSVNPNTVINADAVSSVSEFVAGGLGVALVFPLFVAGFEDRIAVRPFEADTQLDQYLCYAKDARNMRLILEFAKFAKETANNIVQSVMEIR